MERARIKERKISSNSISSSSNSSTSSSIDFQHQLPKPPSQSKPDSSKLLARQRALNSRNNLDQNEKHLINDNLIEVLTLNDTNRPLSSSLSKYKALPQIGTRIDLNRYSRSGSILSDISYDKNDSNNEEILIGFRLPDGSKKQNKFHVNTQIEFVLKYAIENLSDTKNDYLLLQMPNLLLDDLNKTLAFYGIKDKSMLFLIDKNLL